VCKLKRLVIILIFIVLIVGGCNKKTSDKNLSDEVVEVVTNEENEIELEDNAENIKEEDHVNLNEKDKSENLDSDDKSNDQEIKRIEDVALIGEFSESYQLIGLKLQLDGDNKIILDISSEPSYNAELELKDIDGDGSSDIIIREYIGGTGNIQNIYVYLKQDNNLLEVMSDKSYIPQDKFYSEYLGNGYITFEDRNTGFKKEYTIVIPYEHEGWKLEDVKSSFGMGEKAWVDPYSSFEVVDIDKDGVNEVLANQIICGIAHVDLIGEMTTIYKLEKNEYKAIEVIYYSVEHKDWNKEEIGRAKVK